MNKFLLHGLLSKNQGFSLVEAALVLGLLGGFTLIVLQNMQYTTSAKSESLSTQDSLLLSEKITTGLLSKKDCTTMLLGIPNSETLTVTEANTPVSLTQLYDSDGKSIIAQVGQTFTGGSGKLLVNSIQLVPKTPAIAADTTGINYAQHSQLNLGITSAVPGEAQPRSIPLSFNLTTLKDKTTNKLTYCAPPQPWTSAALGISEICHDDSALTWDGISFSCSKAKCPLGTIQMGFNSDNTVKCVDYPAACPKSDSPTAPIQSIVCLSPSPNPFPLTCNFKCKGTVCPPGKFSSHIDSDGFTDACQFSFINLISKVSKEDCTTKTFPTQQLTVGTCDAAGARSNTPGAIKDHSLTFDCDPGYTSINSGNAIAKIFNFDSGNSAPGFVSLGGTYSTSQIKGTSWSLNVQQMYVYNATGYNGKPAYCWETPKVDASITCCKPK